ncbi:MAG: MFS transporter [Gloeobacteraceae cyanobacterium ES-bin-144]|nr:MFS transporter [Verrucomicrobiales bacterium]
MHRYYKWEMLALLWFAFFLNQGDRQIYNAVLPLIGSDLKLSPVQLGLIATLFTAIYGVLVPIAGYAGDIFSRKWMVFTSLFVFSVGTVLTGTAHGFLMLLLFRSIATGAGEAFYYPAANAMIAEFHHQSRARAMAIHQTANYTGVVASGFLAAWIGEHWGWRMSFLAFGLAGVLWAVLVAWRLKDAPRIEEKQGEIIAARIPLGEVCGVIFRKPTVILLSLAFGGMVFTLLGYLTWMPTYLHEKFGVKLASSGFHSVFYHHLLAYAGVLLGGLISDKLSLKRKQARMEIELLGLFLAVPFIFLMGATNHITTLYIALAGYGFFRGIYDSNLMAAPFDVIPPKYRASATGVILSVGFLMGSLAPVVLGWIKTHMSLSAGLSALGYVHLFSAALVFIAMKFFFKSDFYHEPTNSTHE